MTLAKAQRKNESRERINFSTAMLLFSSNSHWTNMNLYDEFEWRGMISEATPGLREVLEREKLTAYIGFDPSAPSLHVGSLLPVMGLARLQRFGHTPIAIAGGGTGLIGDPSGKTKERLLLTNEQVEENLAGIKQQLGRFLDFDTK